jgi:membrane-associated PAP2 superfamily phosphatase
MPAVPLSLPPSWRWLLIHGLLVPGGLVALAAWTAASGTDLALARHFFDPASGAFPARDTWLMETLGHKGGKNAVWLLWLGLLVAAAVAPRVDRLRPYRQVLWLTVAAMGLGPTLVTLLKDINTHVCPWDLKVFGGQDDFSARWFVSRAEAGRCFPGGHAAGGFSLIALYFGALMLGWRRAALAALLATLLVGGLFSGMRMAQGAHFLSHNLWSAAIDWWVAVAVFAPAWFNAARTSRSVPPRSAPSGSGA